MAFLPSFSNSGYNLNQEDDDFGEFTSALPPSTGIISPSTQLPGVTKTSGINGFSTENEDDDFGEFCGPVNVPSVSSHELNKSFSTSLKPNYNLDLSVENFSPQLPWSPREDESVTQNPVFSQNAEDFGDFATAEPLAEQKGSDVSLFTFDEPPKPITEPPKPFSEPPEPFPRLSESFTEPFSVHKPFSEPLEPFFKPSAPEPTPKLSEPFAEPFSVPEPSSEPLKPLVEPSLVPEPLSELSKPFAEPFSAREPFSEPSNGPEPFHEPLKPFPEPLEPFSKPSPVSEPSKVPEAFSEPLEPFPKLLELSQTLAEASSVPDPFPELPEPFAEPPDSRDDYGIFKEGESPTPADSFSDFGEFTQASLPSLHYEEVSIEPAATVNEDADDFGDFATTTTIPETENQKFASEEQEEDDFGDFATTTTVPEPENKFSLDEQAEDDFGDFESTVPEQATPEAKIHQVLGLIFPVPKVLENGRQPPTLSQSCSSSRGALWSYLRDLDSSPALSFQWRNSTVQQKMLETLRINSRPTGNFLMPEWTSPPAVYPSRLAEAPQPPAGPIVPLNLDLDYFATAESKSTAKPTPKPTLKSTSSNPITNLERELLEDFSFSSAASSTPSATSVADVFDLLQ